VALQLNPQSAETHNYWGIALAYKGELEAATARFHAALRLRLGFVHAMNNLGSALAQQGQFDAAIALFCRSSACRSRQRPRPAKPGTWRLKTANSCSQRTSPD